MAVNDVYRPNVDYTLGDQVTSPVSGKTAFVPSFKQVNSAGVAVDQVSYTLASNVTLAATSGSTPITGVQRGNYVWSAVFTGTSVKLQSLAPDGTTWLDVATLSASGVFAGQVSIGANAQLRLYNPNGTSDTGVYSSIS